MELEYEPSVVAHTHAFGIAVDTGVVAAKETMLVIAIGWRDTCSPVAVSNGRAYEGVHDWYAC